MDGQRFAIKLYLNRNKLSALKAQMAGLLMEDALSDSFENCRFAVFDIKAGQFHVYHGASEKLRYLLIGEAAHMSAIIGAVRAA